MFLTVSSINRDPYRLENYDLEMVYTVCVKKIFLHPYDFMAVFS